MMLENMTQWFQEGKMAAGYMDKDFKLVTPDPVVKAYLGDDVTLPCHLSPETSAVAMEIRWFNGTDCIYLYKNGHVTVREAYEGRVSVNTQELQRGNVSLRLRKRKGEDGGGVYTCQVISGEHKEEGRVGVIRALTDWFGNYQRGVGLRVEWEMEREITTEERKRMEESVQSLGIGAGRRGFYYESNALKAGLYDWEEDWEEDRRSGKYQRGVALKGWFVEEMMKREMKREVTAEEKKRMEESVQPLVLRPWRKATDELMKKINQLENKIKEMEKTKQELEEKNKLLQETETDLENMTKREKEREGLLENMTSEMETSIIQLESLEKELQDRNSQLQDLRTQLQEQGRELEERDRQLEERDKQLDEREREQLTDPDPYPVRKRDSMDGDRPNMT